MNHNRNYLNDFKELIFELNKLAPDIAELDLKNNADASRRVIIGLTTFERKSLHDFKNKIKSLRSELINTSKNKSINKNQ